MPSLSAIPTIEATFRVYADEQRAVIPEFWPVQLADDGTILAAGGAGAAPILGVLGEAADKALPVKVQIGGVALVYVSPNASVDAGVFVSWDVNAAGVVTAETGIPVGRTMGPGAAGGLVPVLLHDRASVAGGYLADLVSMIDQNADRTGYADCPLADPPTPPQIGGMESEPVGNVPPALRIFNPTGGNLTLAGFAIGNTVRGRGFAIDVTVEADAGSITLKHDTPTPDNALVVPFRFAGGADVVVEPGAPRVFRFVIAADSPTGFRLIETGPDVQGANYAAKMAGWRAGMATVQIATTDPVIDVSGDANSPASIPPVVFVSNMSGGAASIFGLKPPANAVENAQNFGIDVLFQPREYALTLKHGGGSAHDEVIPFQLPGGVDVVLPANTPPIAKRFIYDPAFGWLAVS